MTRAASGSASRRRTRFAEPRAHPADVFGDDGREDAARPVGVEPLARAVEVVGGEVVLVEVDAGVAVYLEVEHGA